MRLLFQKFWNESRKTLFMARDGHVPPYLDEFVIFSSFHFLSHIRKHHSHSNFVTRILFRRWKFDISVKFSHLKNRVCKITVQIIFNLEISDFDFVISTLLHKEKDSNNNFSIGQFLVFWKNSRKTRIKKLEKVLSSFSR